MRKQEDAELQRLTEALLEGSDEVLPVEEDDTQWVDDYYEDVLPEDPAPTGYTVRNTDTVDVDLDSYSQQVYRGKKGGCLIPGLITLLALCLLTGMVLWLLEYLGVM